MENNIFIKNNIEKVVRGEYSDFLDPYEYKNVISNLNKRHIKYNTLVLFEDETKKIVYSKEYPKISLLKIITNSKLKHNEILGSLFSHNIASCKYGDIIVGDCCYIIVLDSIKKYLLFNLTNIGKIKVKLEEVSINTISDYHYEYEEFNILVSSFRLDNIVSSLTNMSRKTTEEFIKNKFVSINYVVTTKKSYSLNIGDIISIRKYGKYKFNSISKITSKNKYVLNILKYK